jgi:hypothetical protein
MAMSFRRPEAAIWAFAVRFPKPHQAPVVIRRDGRRGFAG